MKQFCQFIARTLVAGVLFILPIYLAIILLAKAVKSLGRLVQPLAKLLPEWLAAETLVSFLLVLALCFVVGVALRTQLRSDGACQDRELPLPENSRLHDVSEHDPATGGRQPRERLEAGFG